MDELSLLEADSIDEAAAAAAATTESALKPVQLPDFTGSLDYIDSLASRSAIAISRRDVSNIATASLLSSPDDAVKSRSEAVPAQNLDSDFAQFSSRLARDRRLFDPEGPFRALGATTRPASRVTSLQMSFPPGWRNPLDPERDPNDISRALEEAERRVGRRPFSQRNGFSSPSLVEICIKRKMRRAVLNAMGVAGLRGFRVSRRSYWSRVIC